jgi:UDP-sugar transporter A1/2/3
LTNSAGGIIVGLVTKYAGSVRKGFALIFGILLSGVIQSIAQAEEKISKEQVVGGALAAVSLYIHAAYPPVLQNHLKQD